jgi:hypothetical protein
MDLLTLHPVLATSLIGVALVTIYTAVQTWRGK